jgi:AcrR family transcriptional regulator
VRRTKEAAQETRNAILDAAERVFFKRGVSQTTLTHIATEANVTRGAIYWHFTGKSALFQAMHDRAKLPQQEFFHAQNMLSHPEPLKVLHETTIECIKRFAADERGKRVFSILSLRCEYVGEMADVMTCQREADDQMHDTIVRVFEKAAAAGQLRRDWTAAMAANACVCVFMGLFTEWLRNCEAFDIVTIGTLTMEGLFSTFHPTAAGANAAERPPVAAVG